MLGQASIAHPEEELPEVDADMRSFIDDVGMATYGDAPALYEVHAHMGEFLTKKIRKHKGRISKKTTIVGTKFSHKLILQAKYKKLGVQAQTRIAAKDLGLGRTGGLRRTMIGIKDRSGKAKARANKVAYLSRNKKQKRHMELGYYQQQHMAQKQWAIPPP